MEMSHNEIVRSYKSAKSKSKQLDILADLNCCDKQKIVDILTENGVQIYGRVKHSVEKENIVVGDATAKKAEIKSIKTEKEHQGSDMENYLNGLFNKDNMKYVQARISEIDKELNKLSAERTFLSSMLESYQKYVEDTTCKGKESSKVGAVKDVMVG